MPKLSFFTDVVKQQTTRNVVPPKLVRDATALNAVARLEASAMTEACRGNEDQAGAVAQLLTKLIDERSRLEDKLQQDYKDLTKDTRFKGAGLVTGLGLAKWLLVDNLMYAMSSDECAVQPSVFWSTLSVLGLGAASLYYVNDKYEDERGQINSRLKELDTEINKLEDVLRDSGNESLLPKLPSHGHSMTPTI